MESSKYNENLISCRYKLFHPNVWQVNEFFQFITYHIWDTNRLTQFLDKHKGLLNVPI